MKFMKGMMVGVAASAGIAMICMDTTGKRKLMKKGKQIAKKMGIV